MNRLDMRTSRRALWPSVALVAAGISVPVYADPPSTQYGLAWEETFSGSSVDTTRWNFRTDVKALSAQLAANDVIDSGQLSLLMKQQAVSGKQYTGGGVVSKQLFGYGYFEVRAKNTTNTGWHNSFWMMAGDGSDTYAAGRYLEIDQAEIDTADQTHIPSGLQIWNGQAGSGANIGGPRCSTYAPGVNLTAAYHTYGADWREGAIDFYLDGVKYCTIAYSTTTYRQDPVNIWLTAIAYQNPVSVGGTPQYYDTVRFYKKDQYVMNGRYGYSETGTGWLDSTLAGFGLMPQRYSCTAGAKAIFAPGFNQSGSYHVYIWKTVNANADTAGEVTVNDAAGATTTTINFTTGTSGWVDLGTHSFNVGTTNPAIGVTNTVHNGCQRAGAAKFVRV
ncbi:MAG TPA: family 16 glycosylhydrolase [Sphingomonas sp.]|nr:family 16 glycosylhydrolase [Sphingomonas sp.]